MLCEDKYIKYFDFWTALDHALLMSRQQFHEFTTLMGVENALQCPEHLWEEFEFDLVEYTLIDYKREEDF